MKNKILIGSIGSNTSIGVAKALKDSGLELFGMDINFKNECPGAIFVDTFFQVPLANSENFEEILVKLITDHQIDCVIPIHDIEIQVISKLAIKFPKLTNWAVNTPEIIEKCNNKREINNFLKDDVLVPKMYDTVADIKFPVIMKPVFGVSSIGIEIFNAANPKIESNDFTKNLIQDFIKGKEFTVDCYGSYFLENIFLYSVRERIETKSGISTKSKIIEHKKIGQLCEIIYKKLNFKGVANIQFMENENGIYFIEINPRFAGSGILTYLSGFNFPLFTVEELVKNVCDFETSTLQIGNKMNRYLAETIYDEKGNRI